MATLYSSDALDGDAFEVLLRDLNPYINDLLEPEFHRFGDLPIELRFQIYGKQRSVSIHARRNLTLYPNL
jgi:hypothetical protein